MPRMVRRAYLLDDLYPFQQPTIRRVLVDAYSVFVPGDAWQNRAFIEENYRLVFLPGEIEYHDWWSGWENGKNARLLDWGWCYGIGRPKQQFFACRRERNQDGSTTIWAAQ